MNDLQEQEKLHSPGDVELKFRRFENRVYRQYDPELYGRQFPVALAVRASLSIPVFYEPLRIRRRPEWDKQNRRWTEEEDLFVDGGVTDNMSISVAMDPFIGGSTNVLAISLGNLGYRLPRAKFSADPAQVLVKSTDYLGDALVDHQIRREHARDQPVMVLDALASVRVHATDMTEMREVVNDGRKIAEDFWSVMQGRPYEGSRATVDWTRVFRRNGQVAQMGIYLSQRARGDQAPEIPPPLRQDLGLWEAVAPLRSRTDAMGIWALLYLGIAVASLGLGSIVSALLEAARLAVAEGRPFQAGSHLSSSVQQGLKVALAGIVATRLIAFVMWRRGVKPTLPFEKRAAPADEA